MGGGGVKGRATQPRGTSCSVIICGHERHAHTGCYHPGNRGELGTSYSQLRLKIMGGEKLTDLG